MRLIEVKTLIYDQSKALTWEAGKLDEDTILRKYPNVVMAVYFEITDNEPISGANLTIATKTIDFTLN